MFNCLCVTKKDANKNANMTLTLGISESKGVQQREGSQGCEKICSLPGDFPDHLMKKKKKK